MIRPLLLAALLVLAACQGIAPCISIGSGCTAPSHHRADESDD